MAQKSGVIFLTGASGFLGSHILTQLLEQGYHVRAAVREKKANQFKNTYKRFREQLEVVPISDIATDQFPDALKGVDAVIHTAAPLAGRVNDAGELLKGVVEGALNTIRQAERAGVTRIVLTSSRATASTPQFTFTDQDWYPVTREEAERDHGLGAYRAAKTIAEKEVWKFAESHPHLDVTTLNPPFFYGPYAEGFDVATSDYYALSTNINIYRLLVVNGEYPPSGAYIDVRDIAKAHILALNSPPFSSVGRKRIILTGPNQIDFDRVVSMLRTKRPELKERLIKKSAPKYPEQQGHNIKRIEEVLGMKEKDFVPLEDTILDAVDGLLTFEKRWLAEGVKIEIPLL